MVLKTILCMLGSCIDRQRCIVTQEFPEAFFELPFPHNYSEAVHPPDKRLEFQKRRQECSLAVNESQTLIQSFKISIARNFEQLFLFYEFKCDNRI